MKFTFPAFLCCLLWHTTGTFAQLPVIRGVQAKYATVEQYGKFEANIDLSAAIANPYDYDEVVVHAVFTSPDQRTFSVDGFFMQEHTMSTQGVLTPLNSGNFRLRFAPDQPGVWSYVVSCTLASGKATFTPQTFTCIPASTPTNKGFVRSKEGNYFVFDQGTPFIPIGENIGWQNGNPFIDYSNWLTKLQEHKGNFFRIWQAHWGLGIEWRNGSSGFQGLRKYKQTNAAYLDWLMDFSAEKGLYMMFCIQHHGQVSSAVNPNWSDSPYNAIHGGPCARTWDFFTNETAKKHTRNRLRYTLARWGYARSIMAWELFNEVDWTDDFENRKQDVNTWHTEMSAFIRQTDPYKHFVTTSYGRDQYDPALWNTSAMDFTQTHYYLDIPNLERAIGQGTRQYLSTYKKPNLNGEFGLGGSAESLGNIDANGIYVHNSLWGSLFAGGAGAGLTWWWDNYIHPRNLYYHFAPIAEVASRIPFSQNNFTSIAAQVTGAAADLSLTPALGWGALGTSTITIGPSGSLQPVDAALSSYLYGAQWNTQFRRPPTFQVHYPASGKFTVTTGSTAGTSPKIALWLDGKVVLETNAGINQTFSIDVPAGAHVIKVDNSGTDWISIKAYLFSGLGSAVDAYVLRSADQTTLSAWVLNHAYNHSYVKTKGLPKAVAGATLQVDSFQNGTYIASWYNCLTGALEREASVVVVNQSLSLPIPELAWDLALTLQPQLVSVAERIPAFPFSLFPNPVSTTGTVSVQFELMTPAPVHITLLDASGRAIRQVLQQTLPGGSHLSEFEVPTDLPRGIYWIQVRAGQAVGVRPLVTVY